MNPARNRKSHEEMRYRVMAQVWDKFSKRLATLTAKLQTQRKK